MSKTISMCQGKGSLSHNNREFTAKNIDPSRTPDNIIFKQQDLGEAYHQLFDGVIAKIAQKRVKLDDIDKLDTGKTMFGGKVTVAKDDWENITALAKREVASTKQVRKLKKERDEAVQKYDELKDKYDTASEELSAYKKKEKEGGLFTREKLKKEAARISREDELSRELRKAKAFISACGLSSDFQQYKYNSNTRKKTLE